MDLCGAQQLMIQESMFHSKPRDIISHDGAGNDAELDRPAAVTADEFSQLHRVRGRLRS